jgi:hypothetical protein
MSWITARSRAARPIVTMITLIGFSPISGRSTSRSISRPSRIATPTPTTTAATSGIWKTTNVE